jgi:5-methylcytosine-specific restriction protein A
MGRWIIPCNLKNYDLVSAFSAHQEVDWKQIKSIEAGDRVMIYIASPVSAVRDRCVVKETELPGPNVIGAEYNRDETPYGSAESHMTLVKAFEYDDPRLSLKALRAMGVGHVQGPRRTPANLDELVSEIEESAEFEGIFAPTDDPVATIPARGCYEEGKCVVSLERY